VTVKPFCAGTDFLRMTGQKADVGPSEYVPLSFGMFPPPLTLLEHLYELGYQDMETWLERHLDERLEQLRAKGADQQEDLPPVTFDCENDGMLWHKEVLQRVPVKWADMLKSRKFLDDKDPVVLHQGKLELEALLFFVEQNGQEVQRHEVADSLAARWMVLTDLDLQWRAAENADAENPGADEQEKVEWMIREMQGAVGNEASREKFIHRLTSGRVHLSWISDATVDLGCHKCSVDTPERHFIVSTVNYSLVLRAASHEEAVAWTTALQDALAATRDYVPKGSKVKGNEDPLSSTEASLIDKE